MYQWVYAKGVHEFEKMTNLSVDLRKNLTEKYFVGLPSIMDHEVSNDGTQKWSLDMAGPRAGKVEMVYIPMDEASNGTPKGAVCVSSQVGCALKCTFCHTATMPKKNTRNLSAAEIVGQVLAVKKSLGDFQGAGKAAVSNIVMMGMGEPLLNYSNLIKTISTLRNPIGLAFSRRKITVSTSGIVPAIHKLAKDEEHRVKLAISLHATSDDLRNEIVPINKTYPLSSLIEACTHYPGRRITFEYVMLMGINDSKAQARDLVRILKPVTEKLVNLIPFNPWPGAPYACSPDDIIQKFAETLRSAGVPVTIRWPRGRDISAACGQLAIKELLDNTQ